MEGSSVNGARFGKNDGNDRNMHVPRVIKLDAELLDSQLHDILKMQFLSCFKYLNPSLLSKLDPELDALLKLIFLKFTVFSKNSTVGQQMLNLRYSSDRLSSCQCIFYAFISTLLPWISHRSSSSGSQSLNKFFKLLHYCASMISIINFLVFLTEGRFPTIKERLLNLEIVPFGKNKLRQVSFDFMNRELLWHGVMDFLKCVLPYISIRKFKIILGIEVQDSHRSHPSALGKCNLCHRFYVMPHHLGCNHPYCYYCLQNEIAVNSGFKCLVCQLNNNGLASVKPLIVQKSS